MRAAVVVGFGRLPIAVQVKEPAAPVGSVLVDMECAAVNPFDLLVATGGGAAYGGPPGLPYVPGIGGIGRDASGHLVYVQGGGLGITRDGALAERVAVPEGSLVPVPVGADAAAAAAVAVAGMAGWGSVTLRAAVQPGDVVVVLGATSSAGRVALQAAREAGARRLVAVARRPDRVGDLIELADSTVRLGPDLEQRLATACGDPADVVIDFLWGEHVAAALGAIAPGGRVVQAGALAGPDACLPAALLRSRRIELLGYATAGLPDDVQAALFRTVVERHRDGYLRLPYDVVPLEEVGVAWEVAAAGGPKQVVRLDLS